MDLEGAELVDNMQIKEVRYLTRYKLNSGAVFNLDDPDRRLTSILPYLEMTASLNITHAGLLKGKQDWGKGELT